MTADATGYDWIAYAVAKRFRNSEWWLDCVQEGLLCLCQSIPNINPDMKSKPSTYLYAMCWRRVRDFMFREVPTIRIKDHHERSGDPRVTCSLDDPALEWAEPACSVDYPARLDAIRLRCALDALPVKFREVLVAVDLDGLRQVDYALCQGVSREAIRQRRQAALRKMKRLLCEP
jgi:RNA polymerase sigma factor (sigma-70 family)